MDAKYELTEESISIDGHTLYRIRAIRSFGKVKAGDLGGYLEYNNNLSHYDNCWVSDKAKVYERGTVTGTALVTTKSQVYGDAWVGMNAKISGEAHVFDDASVYGNSKVYGKARVFEKSRVLEKARIYDNAHIFGYAQIAGEVRVCGDAYISGINIIFNRLESIKIDRGIWSNEIKIDGKYYLISSTLEKLLTWWEN